MKTLLMAVLLAGMLPMNACAKANLVNSATDEFSLSKYLGVWYEIARFENSFEKGMDNTKAEYLLQDNGKVTVLNSGWSEGKYKIIEGKAKYPDPINEPGALRVSFFMFFYSDYDVLMVDEDYQIALVGSKSDKYLWLLSRSPLPDPFLIEMALEVAELNGYDTDKLLWVDQGKNIAW